MTPQLQQAIKMLQLSNLELSQAIEEELIENPALDKEEKQEYSLDELSEEDLSQKIEKAKDEKVAEDFNEEILYTETPYTTTDYTSGEDKKREFLEGAVFREETLKEYLTQQLHLLDIGPEELKIAEILISYIDEQGYLSVSLDVISGEFSISEEKLGKALTIVQGLDPPGVGAREIRECLLIQLRNDGNHPIAERIVSEYLEAIKLKKFDEIAKKCKISKSKLQEVISIISQLEPYPGRQYNSEDIRYIVPDVIVEEREGEFEVIPNSSSLPRLRVNRYFEDLLRKRNIEKRVKDFISEKVARARTFMHSIEQRESTLLRVMKAILEKQMGFFEQGPMYLKPMTLRDISQILDLHESTISRITSSKYAQTPFGVYGLKYFFSNSIPSQGQGDYSSTSIKEIMKEIIENEEGKKHLSDQKIVELLHKRGIQIARRTVAKYRKDLHILPSNLRRSK
jgi:RNA polymerase sigma-54 factor